jgi:AcrR family transcriptional regulator
VAKEGHRSKATRERIEVAARTIFSRYGYERSTIRAIAAAALIHPSMVMRYFGSKEALFARVVRFELRLPNLTAVPPQELGAALVRHFLERWENGAGELPALLRAAVSNVDARARMAEIFEQQLTHATSSLGDPATAPRRATLVASQMLGLALTRYVLEFDAALAMSQEEIVQSVGPTIQSYLLGSGTS